jgi:hypothetical protein
VLCGDLCFHYTDSSNVQFTNGSKITIIVLDPVYMVLVKAKQGLKNHAPVVHLGQNKMKIMLI